MTDAQVIVETLDRLAAYGTEEAKAALIRILQEGVLLEQRKAEWGREIDHRGDIIRAVRAEVAILTDEREALRAELAQAKGDLILTAMQRSEIDALRAERDTWESRAEMFRTAATDARAERDAALQLVDDTLEALGT